MKNKIRELAENYPKHYTRMIRKNTEMLDFINSQTESLPPECKLPERVYVLLNGDSESACPHGNRKVFYTVTDGYKFCGPKAKCQCSRENQSKVMAKHHSDLPEDEMARRLSKQKETLIARYGVDNSAFVPGASEKAKATTFAKRGVEHHMLDPKFKADLEAANIERTGYAYPLLDPVVQEKCKDAAIAAFGSIEASMAHARKAFEDSHDGLNPFQIPEVNAKRETTMYDRHGVNRPLKSPKILKKMQEKFLTTHGFSNPMHLPSVKEVMKENSKEKYGVAYPNQKHISPETLALLIDREAFDIYRDAKSLRFMAHDLGVSYKTIQRAYENFGIPIPKSSYEIEIINWLYSLGFTENDLVIGKRNIIAPLELDIAIPRLKIAIEFGGLYYHSECHQPDKNYHLTKHIATENAGYRLITIFEDEMVHKRDIVFSRIGYMLGFGEKGVGARKATIDYITTQEANRFIEKHHIQGKGSIPRFCVGAHFNGELIAVMTFGNPRGALGNSKRGGYELLRFSTDGRNHPGIASRLFKFFVDDARPGSIHSYADRRWSDGGLYRALGFKEKNPTIINYWWVDLSSIKRYHRYRFNKAKLLELAATEFPDVVIDNKFTEKQIMELTYDFPRIYDCGSLSFEWLPI